MATLHVSRVTPRLRQLRGIKWPRFRKALIHAYSAKSEDFSGLNGSEKFWHDQLDMFNGGVRDHRIDPLTFKAVEWCVRYPMGH